MSTKADERFTQKAEDVKVIHVPQCSKCLNSIDYVGCRAFGSKPKEYTSNQTDCPRFDKR